MSGDEAALLAAVIAAPEDDLPRLVYADWLDERGEGSDAARAEYIRLGVEYARTSPEMTDAANRAALKRLEELFATHGAAWFPAFQGRRHLFRSGRAFRSFARGFPHRVSAQATKLLEVGDEMTRLGPVTSVRVGGTTPALLRCLVESPWVGRLREVWLDADYFAPALDWGELAGGPHFARLDSLTLVGGVIGAEAARRLAGADPFPRLRRLRLSAALSPHVVTNLFAGPAFGGLRELAFGSGYLDWAGAGAVAAAPALERLESLVIEGESMRGLGENLVRAAFWPGLRRLTLWGCSLRNADLAELAGGAPNELRSLDVGRNAVTPAGARSLAGSTLLDSLRELNLSSNPIRDAGAAALADSPRVASLGVLNMAACGLTPAGARALAESPHLAGLQELNLSSNAIELGGAKALAASPHLGGLVRLRVGNLTATARKHLNARFGNAVTF